MAHEAINESSKLVAQTIEILKDFEIALVPGFQDRIKQVDLCIDTLTKALEILAKEI